MKCTESEDEDPTKGSESQLQLSCFINQEVKYLATGLRLVSGTSRTQMSHQCSQSLLILICLSLYPEATGGHHEVLPILTEKCPLYQIGMFYLLAFLTFVASVERSCFVQCFLFRTWIKWTVTFYVSAFKSKISRLPAYLTVQMVRFFYKEKESVNAKVLKVGILPRRGLGYQVLSPKYLYIDCNL